MAEVAEGVVPREKKGLAPWVIILAAVLAAVIAGGAVYFLTGEESAAPDKEHPAKKAADAKKPKAPAMYVKLDPPFVANFEAKGLVRFLQVSVEVMTRDAATAGVMKAHDPMIRNDLLMLFGNQKYENLSSVEGKGELRAEALERVRKVVREEGGDASQVEQLYFTSFVMQ
jgi:flagellar FliL protein